MEGQEEQEEQGEGQVAGDVLGSTAYSERFVLKLLMRLSALGQEEGQGEGQEEGEEQEKEEEDEEQEEERPSSELEAGLCTLWDMSAERDVVRFLLRHGLMALVRAAWGRLTSSARLAEVTVGLLGNMCCWSEAAAELARAAELCAAVLRLGRSGDSRVLLQVLRLVNSLLYEVRSEDAPDWLERLAAADYVPALAFILTSSTNPDLLLTAVENLNAICSKCNMAETRSSFFNLVVVDAVVDGLHDSFDELTGTQRGRCDQYELDRLLILTLEITSTFIGFDRATEMYEHRKDRVSSMITSILRYFKVKMLEDKVLDTDLVEIVESICSICSILKLYGDNEAEVRFTYLYKMWATTKSIDKLKSSRPSFNDKYQVSDSDVQALLRPLKTNLCSFMCDCLEPLPEQSLLQMLNMVGNDFNEILNDSDNKKLSEIIRNKVKTQHKTIQTDF